MIFILLNTIILKCNPSKSWKTCEFFIVFFSFQIITLTPKRSYTFKPWVFIVYIGVSTAPLKNTTPLAKPTPLKSANCPRPPFSMNPKNIKVFQSFTSSYLLRVTKFLVKISQFEFLVMTKQRILVYKLFLSLNTPDFSLLFVEKLQPSPLKKVIPFSQQPPLKTEVLSSPPVLKIW